MPSSTNDTKVLCSANKTIKVACQASNKVKCYPIDNQHPDISLLEFLQQQGLPIASSCSGKGLCRRCAINENLLSCQINLGQWDLDRKIEVSYL